MARIVFIAPNQKLCENGRRMIDDLGMGQQVDTYQASLSEGVAIARRAEAEGVRGEPAGTLRLNLPVTFGKRVMVPLLATLVARHPRLALDLTFSDRFEDVHLLVPYVDGGALADLYGLGAPIAERRDTADGVHVRARLPRQEISRFARFLVAGDDEVEVSAP